MCMPLAAGVGLSLLGGGMSAFGQMGQADAAADAEKYNIAIEENNIRNIRMQSALERDELSTASGQQLATGQTSLAAGNVAVDTGSAMDWAADIDMALESDLSRVAFDERSGVQAARMRIAQGKSRISSAKRSGILGAAGSLIGAGASSAFAFA